MEETIPAGTIILNMNVIRNDNSGIDIYHECIHWEWHYMFFLLQEMHCTDMGTVKTVETDTSEADDADARHTIWGIEWQARQGSCRLMLPERLARPWIMEAYANVTDKYEREASKVSGYCLLHWQRTLHSLFPCARPHDPAGLLGSEGSSKLGRRAMGIFGALLIFTTVRTVLLCIVIAIAYVFLRKRGYKKFGVGRYVE